MDTIVQNKFNPTNLTYEQKDGLAFAFNIHYFGDLEDDFDIFDVLKFEIYSDYDQLDLQECTPD